MLGHFSFEAQAPPIDWQGAQVPNHATSYAKQLRHDLQVLRFHLEGAPDEEFTVGKLLEDGSAILLELANLDFAVI